MSPSWQVIKNIIASPERYGITLPAISNTPYFTTVRKQRDIDVEVAAQLAEMSVDEFRDLNPAHNRPVIKADPEAPILLPADKADIFLENLKSYSGRLSAWTTYQSKKGESFTAIARKFGMPLEQLRQVNGLSRRQSAARRPTTLLVAAAPAKPAQAGTHNAAQGASAPPAARGGIRLASLDTSAGRPAAAKRGTTPTPPARSARRESDDVQVLRRNTSDMTHTVQRGDTLFALARRYNTTVDALRKLNNLKGNKLATGKRLRVPGSHISG